MTKINTKSYSPPTVIDEPTGSYIMHVDEGISSALHHDTVNKRKYSGITTSVRRMPNSPVDDKKSKNSKWFNRALFGLLGIWFVFLTYVVVTAAYSANSAADDIPMRVPQDIVNQVVNPPVQQIPAPKAEIYVEKNDAPLKVDDKKLLQVNEEQEPAAADDSSDDSVPLDDEDLKAGFPMNDVQTRAFGPKCERGIGRVPIYSNNPKYQRIEEYDFDKQGPFNMTYFYKTYILGQKPVIIKNSINHWRATTLWKSDEYLAQAAGNENVIVEQSLNNKFGFVEKTWSRKLNMKMKDFLQLYKQKDPNGYQYYQATKVWPSLRKDYVIQDYAPCLNQTNLPYYHHFGIWFGYGGQNSLIHNDPEDNFLNILDGYKRLIMYPPEQGDMLYEDRRAEARTSEVNIADPDYKQFPLFAHVTPYEVIVGPGDVLFIPAYWFHQVESSCRHLAFNLFFDIHNNMGVLERERAKMANPDVDLDPKSGDLVKMLMEMPSQCEVANQLKEKIMAQKKK